MKGLLLCLCKKGAQAFLPHRLFVGQWTSRTFTKSPFTWKITQQASPSPQDQLPCSTKEWCKKPRWRKKETCEWETPQQRMTTSALRLVLCTPGGCLYSKLLFPGSILTHSDIDQLAYVGAKKIVPNMAFPSQRPLQSCVTQKQSRPNNEEPLLSAYPQQIASIPY